MLQTSADAADARIQEIRSELARARGRASTVKQVNPFRAQLQTQLQEIQRAQFIIPCSHSVFMRFYSMRSNPMLPTRCDDVRLIIHDDDDDSDNAIRDSSGEYK